MRAHIMNASANGTKGSAWRLPAVYAGGVLFGFGLAYSGMARPEVVLDFLQLDDLGLLVVMGVAVVVAMLGFHVGPRLLGRAVAPLTGRRYQPRKLTFRPRVVGGAAIFGVGWGLSGVCPGAAFASLGLGNLPILWGIAGMLLGAYLLALWEERRGAVAQAQGRVAVGRPSMRR